MPSAFKELIARHATAVLYLATLGATALGFLVNILLTQRMTPESFGYWRYFLSMLVLSGYLTSLGVFHAGGQIMASRTAGRSNQTLKGLLLLYALAATTATGLTILAIGWAFPSVAPPAITEIIVTFGPLLIVHGLSHYFEATYQGEGNVRGLSAYRLFPPAAFSCALFFFLKDTQSTLPLVAGIFYMSYGTVYAILIFTGRPSLVGAVLNIKDLWRKVRAFGSHVYLGSLAGNGATNLLPLLIGTMGSGGIEVGKFVLATSFLMPVTMLPGIVGTASYRKMVGWQSLQRKAVLKIALACSFALAALLVSVDELVHLFFGQQYSDVARLVKIGAFGTIAHGLGDYINKFLLSKGEASRLKYVSWLVGAIQTVLAFVLIPHSSAEGAMVSQAIASCAYFSSLILLYFWWSKHHGDGRSV